MALEKYQVFLNFRGKDTYGNFATFLYQELRRNAINVYMDRNELRGLELDYLFERIEQSRIALVVFSENYANSRWCLDELVKIKQQRAEGKLVAIPIFYKVKAADVKYQRGTFGAPLMNADETFHEHSHKVETWKEALHYISHLFAHSSDGYRTEAEMIDHVVKTVQEHLQKFLSEERYKTADRDVSPTEKRGKPPPIGIESRLKHLEDKLNFESAHPRVVAIVGMVGIGKTTLAKLLYEKWNHRFNVSKFLPEIQKQSEKGLDGLLKEVQKTLLMDDNNPELRSIESLDEFLKTHQVNTKVFFVLDDVSDKEQIEILMGKCDWMPEGSKIVITTRDKKLIKNLVDDYFVVPRLNDAEALQLFTYHTFDNIRTERNFVNLSKFIDYAKGNPFALKLMGKDPSLCEGSWQAKLAMLDESSNGPIQKISRIIYDELSMEQKDAFLDVACFFRSEDEYYVRSLLDSTGSDSTEAATVITDLADKFLITISDERVEMHDLLCTMGKKVGLEESVQELGRRRRLWNHQDIIRVLKNKQGTENVRGIFLDMSKVKKMSLRKGAFINMRNLRYLKFYDSHCSRQCETDCKLFLPEGLEFPLDEIRCLHWLKFPSENLPSDFNPKNLVDLKLPYSKIQQLWGDNMDIGKLKWIDLNHSRNLCNLSGLLHARNLERLNLEGCASLVELPSSMQNLQSLIFLNLRGCTSLTCLPTGMNLKSLRTLITSGCSNLQRFQLISENLEAIHLDGTPIKELPSAIKKLDRLALLNLKHCMELKRLPNCLGKLKSLQKLVLSGCSMLSSFPGIKEQMNRLEILLLDGTSIKKMPEMLDFPNLKTFWFCRSEGKGSAKMSLPPLSAFPRLRDLCLSDSGLCEWPHDINRLSSLQSLCLRRNDIEILHESINQLYNLKWLDLRYCRKLKSIPMLPPNLQWLDANGCDSLETVACQKTLPTALEQIHSTLIFTNCSKLDQTAKDEIVSYAQKRSQFLGNSLKRCDGGVVPEPLVGTCFPGCEVPFWFSDQTVGSILETHLPPHWCESKFIGMALCAVVSFKDNEDQINCFSVKCTCELTNEETSPIRFNCTVGGWTEQGNEGRSFESDHVFVGYNSCLHIMKRHKENHHFGRCTITAASFKFHVTDETGEVARCEVVKCGFSLLYDPDETHNIYVEANFDVTRGKRAATRVDNAENPVSKRRRRQ